MADPLDELFSHLARDPRWNTDAALKVAVWIRDSETGKGMEDCPPPLTNLIWINEQLWAQADGLPRPILFPRGYHFDPLLVFSAAGLLDSGTLSS